MKLFISYAREDAEKASEVAKDLLALENAVWFDQEIAGGQAWWDHILEQIRAAEVVIVIVSPALIESQACRLELAYAISLRRQVLPVLVVRNVNMSTLPTNLAQLQFIDRQVDDKAALLALMKAMKRLPPVSPLPDPLPPQPAAPVSLLGGIREQIESATDLDRKEQWDIVGRLKAVLRDDKNLDAAADLVKRFRARDDLLAVVALELDQMAATATTIRGGPIRPNTLGRLTLTEQAKPHSTKKRHGRELTAAEVRGLSRRFIQTGYLSNSDLLALVRSLIEMKEDLSIRSDANGDSLLHCAARTGAEQVVQLLLKHGADIRKENSLGRTPIDVANSSLLAKLLRAAH